MLNDSKTDELHSELAAFLAAHDAEDGARGDEGDVGGRGNAARGCTWGAHGRGVDAPGCEGAVRGCGEDAPGCEGVVGGCSRALSRVRTLKASDHEVTELVRVGESAGLIEILAGRGELTDDQGECATCSGGLVGDRCGGSASQSGHSADQAGFAALEPGTLLIRKKIDAESGLGRAYATILDAQQRGFSSPAVPRVYSVEENGSALTVLMERVDGETLDELVARMGASPELAADVFGSLCDAVEVLHEGLIDASGAARPLIHRDLKPSNILVCGCREAARAPERLALIDFGIARAWHEDAVADTVKFGTRSYAPPEQFGFGQTDVRSDVYALGAVLYFCLVGEDPKPGKKVAQLVEAAGIAEPFARVIVRAMALDPDDRYASVRELRSAFEAACRELGLDRASARDKRVLQQSAGVQAMPPVQCPGATRTTSTAWAAVQATPPAQRPIPQVAPLFNERADSRPIKGAPRAPVRRSPLQSSSQVISQGPIQVGDQRATQSVVGFEGSRPQSAARRILGIVWNFALACGYAFLLAATWFAVFEPTDANARLSTWYLALQYVTVVDVPTLLLMLWLLDKSRLVRRFPILARARGAAYPLIVIAGAVLAFVAVVVLGALAGQV